MNRCKCILAYKSADEGCEFLSEQFYQFDYVPPMGERQPFYKVFANDGQHHINIDIRNFSKHFKKY